MGVAGSGHNYAVVNVQAVKVHTGATPRAASNHNRFTDAATGCSKWDLGSRMRMPLKQNPHHQTPRETTNGHRSCSKAKDLPQADGQKRRPGCSRTPWHRGCPVKAAQRRRWHDTRKDDDTKTTAVRDGPHEYRPHSLHYHLSSPTSD